MVYGDTYAVSVVVPVYNSSATMNELADRLTRVMTERGTEFEIILVNDDSRDDSWERIVELCRTHPSAVGINLMTNVGQHAAVLAGIRHARSPIIVTLDDDLQHRPEDIPSLLAALNDDVDVVYGKEVGAGHGLWRRLASAVTRFVLQGAMGVEIAGSISNFRALRTSIRAAFTEVSSPYVSIDVMLTWGTRRFRAVPVPRERRRAGSSNYTLRGLATHTLNMLTGFSTAPLQLASIVGFSFTLFGLVVLSYVLIAYLLQGGGVPGFPFLASLIAIMSGAQLFALGIIGEYLARVHVRAMRRPPYVVREAVGRRSPPESPPQM